MAMFGKKESSSSEPEIKPGSSSSKAEIVVLGELSPEEQSRVSSALSAGSMENVDTLPMSLGSETKYLILLDPSNEQLSRAAAIVCAARQQTNNGFPVILSVISPTRLTEFGKWLISFSQGGQLEGLRVICEAAGIKTKDLAKYAGAVFGPDLILMPISPEIPNSPVKPFFSLSPESRKTVRFVGELAQNDIARVCKKKIKTKEKK